MTIVAAWIREVDSLLELVVASDSRLSGGHTWDACPKLMPLGRGDAVLCFAGATLYAYPIMLQLHTALNMNERLTSRSIDITDLKGSIAPLIQDLLSRIADDPDAPILPKKDFELIFAGYSWKLQKFMIWSLSHDNRRKTVFFVNALRSGGQAGRAGPFCLLGDAKGDGHRKLWDLLEQRKKLGKGGLDMEPLEVIVDMIKQGNHRTVGGPPQVVRVYRHLNAEPLNVYWTDGKTRRKSVLGRFLQKYEKNRFLTLDPETMDLLHPDTDDSVYTIRTKAGRRRIIANWHASRMKVIGVDTGSISAGKPADAG